MLIVMMTTKHMKYSSSSFLWVKLSGCSFMLQVPVVTNMMTMTDMELSSSSFLSWVKINSHSSMQQVRIMIISTMYRQIGMLMLILRFKKLSIHSFKPIPALLMVFPEFSLMELKTF